MKYSKVKNEIYGYYKHMGHIDNDNIMDVNDHIIDEHLSSDRFEEFMSELFITVSMCIYMIENNLYDEYFFNSYKELLNEYNNTKNMYNGLDEDLKNDMDNLNDYIKKDEIKSKYYDRLDLYYCKQKER